MRALVLLSFVLGACSSPPSSAPSVEPPVDRVAYTMVATAFGTEIPAVSLPERPDIARWIDADLTARVDPEGCDEPGGWFEPTVSVPFAEADVLSVEVHVGSFCGGAYPTNDANRSVTFDLRTGEAVSFASLFVDAGRDAGAIRTAYLGAVGTSGVEGCEEVLTDETLSSYGFAFALAPEGVILQPEFPHVIEACADRAVVPYASLGGLLAPDGLAARVAATR